MSLNPDNIQLQQKSHNNKNVDSKNENCNEDRRSSSPSSSSSITSSSSSPSSSSDGSSSSSELNPSDALQSPLTGLLNFEGFSMPQMSDFGISNIDMPRLPSLPNLRSFNMPRFQTRLPNLTTNLQNLQNLTTNMPNLPNLPNFPNLSYLTQLRNVNTAAELQNLFNLFRISANLRNLPAIPQFPQFPQFPQLPQLAPLFSGSFSGGPLLKSWTHMKESVRNMHRRLNDITHRFPNNFHFREWQMKDGTNNLRIYFLLNDFIYYCDTQLSDHKNSKHHHHHNHHSSNVSNGKKSHHHRLNNHRHDPYKKQTKNEQQPHLNQPSPSTSTTSDKHNQNSSTDYNHTTGSDSLVCDHANNYSKSEILNSQPLHPLNLICGGFDRIDCYEYEEKFSRFVFSNGNNLYYFDDCVGQDNIMYNVPIKIETKCEQTKNDFKLCPSNPDLVAYHCQGDIWCVNLRTNQELRLTDLAEKVSSSSSNPNRTPLSDYLTATFSSSSIIKEQNLDSLPFMLGRPSHIIREEFKRHHGFWWRGQSEYQLVNSSENSIEYQLLYEETDQTKVDLVMMPSHNGIIEGQRFPKAGGFNPISKLKIAKFEMNLKNNKLSDEVTTDLLPELRDLFPECEYLVRAGWLGQEVIWFQMLNRRQTNLVIALVSLTGSFESQIIYEEHNDIYWVSAHDNLYFLNASKLDLQPLVEGSDLSFIWSSEESGFRHLYLIKIKIGSARMSPKMIVKKQLTEGSWEVNGQEFWVDEGNMLIYFCGLKDTPLEKHLYVLKYADNMDEKHSNHHGKNKVHRLTELNFTQSNIAFNANRSIFVNIQSNISVPPFGFVNRIIPSAKYHRRLPDSKRLSLLLVNSFIYSSYESPNLDNHKSIAPKPSITYDCQADLLPGLGKPELFCCQLISGELIYGSIFKPEFMESGVRYPTVLEIYGGPEIQLVSNNFMSLRQPTRHLLSSEGYVVILIDCRGSGHRGLSFEAHSFRQMGQVELADQVEVLQWLAKNTGYIDLDRVAIKGWSYGGYLSLMALAQYPKVFKIAIAGAPVTDWQMYDTAYTERFMGLPRENTEGYFKGSVLSYVHLFPDQENRLLLLHGMMDENVHFSHTVSLINALIEAGKPYDLQVFPTERHILKSPTSCENYMTCVLSYLQLNL